MNSLASDDLDKRMAAVMKSFADGLPARIEALVDSFHHVAVGGSDQLTALQSLQAVSHKLAGSAGTFGFLDVYDVAQSIEMICMAAVDEYPAGINVHVDSLRTALQPLVDERG